MEDAAQPHEPVTASLASPVGGEGQTAGIGSSPPVPPPNGLPAGLLVAGRYRLGETLGEGGMGRVYRAFDVQLERPVAVKLLHPGPGEPAARLLREARAQARVNHDHVAKVVEAGSSDGVLYIAMQLVDGPSLRQASGSLTLQEKVEVIRQASLAVHAAHLEGLVHRDIKPGNIMLERTDSGAWKAYVVDFGLVRDLDAGAGLSAAVVAGTPHYMAPEQVRGESARVDWRTDVYSLGATLYELLVGAPPFHARSAAEALVLTLEEPARFPRAHARVPRDLQAITLRCLEKEPQDRYGSARELAEDLGRFLRGESVQARPVPAAVRLLRAARRHPRVTAAALLAAASVVVLAALWLDALLRSRRVADLARRFGEEVAVMESIGRLAALQPLHDIRREQALIRTRLAALDEQVERQGAVAEGPGRLALGRGWLALGDAAAARRELDAAWGSGYRTPEVAAARGEALAALYRTALEEARRVENKAQREARTAAIERELRDPALAALTAAGSTIGGRGDWVEGQLHLLARRWDKAIASARVARAATPWLYETWRLEGDVLRERAEESARSGAWQEALRWLERAGTAYATGIDAARSDVALREAECRRRVRVLAVDDGRELPVAERAEWALVACRDAAVVQPDSASAYSEIAEVHRRLGAAELAAGGDPRPTLVQGLVAARKGIAVDPDFREALTEIGLCLRTRADWEALHGIDPRPVLLEAITALNRALSLDPSHAPAHTSLGVAYERVADWENEHDQDPRAALAAALEHAEAALRLVPQDAAGHHNLAVTYLRKAGAPGRWGLDPARALSSAAEHFRAAIARRPDLYQSHNGLGNVLKKMAEAARGERKDRRPLLDEAIACFDTALALRPDFGWALFNRSITLRIRARDTSEQGGDPFPDLLASRRDLERARELMPEDPDVSSSMAATLVLQATETARRGGDPRQLLREALREAELTVTRNPGEAFAWGTRGEAYLLSARDAQQRGDRWEGELERAQASIARGQSVDPNAVDLWVLEGEVWLARARWVERDRADTARRAVAAYRHALDLNPRSRAELDTSLAEAEALAGTQTAGSASATPGPTPPAPRSPASPS